MNHEEDDEVEGSDVSENEEEVEIPVSISPTVIENEIDISNKFVLKNGEIVGLQVIEDSHEKLILKIPCPTFLQRDIWLGACIRHVGEIGIIDYMLKGELKRCNDKMKLSVLKLFRVYDENETFYIVLV